MNPFIAILLAGLAGWIFGAVWYMALGKVWQAALGMDPQACKGQKMPLAPMLVSLLGALVMSAVLYQILANLGVMGVLNGAIAGLTIGIGFLGTATLVGNMFQQKKWAVTLIDGGHWVLAVTLEAVVLKALA